MTDSLCDVLSTDPFAPVWFFAGSFVDEARRILYVATPKVACSSVKYFMRSLVTDGPLVFNATRPETKLTMMIHDRPQFPLPSLMHFSPERVDEIVTGEGWFRFCVVRHPIERFFSAWRDKIFLCEPGFEAYLPAGGRAFVEFRDFLDRVVTTESARNCETHWRSQVTLLRPDQIDYTRIYDLGTITELAADLARHLAIVDPSMQAPSLERQNQGYPISSAGFLSADVIARLRDFYDADFQRFGFAELKPPEGPVVTGASLVSPFTNAIWDRNRVIAIHNLAAVRRDQAASDQA